MPSTATPAPSATAGRLGSAVELERDASAAACAPDRGIQETAATSHSGFTLGPIGGMMGHGRPADRPQKITFGEMRGAGFSGTAIAMMNDTEIFDEMCFDVRAGKNVWTGRTGTREAIQRDGHTIDPASQAFCPHEWLDERGYIDTYLALKHHF